MIIRKKTIDNNVKYTPQSEQTRDNKLNMIKNVSLLKKQNKNVSQNKESSLKIFQDGDLKKLNDEK